MNEKPSYGSVAERARAWWRALQPVAAEGGPNPSADRAALSRLRRATTAADAMADEATLMLFRRLGLGDGDIHDLPRVAFIAMTLAHVREDARPDAAGRRPPAVRAVGRAMPEDADSAAMSPLRFRRLLACRDDEELAQQMRRLVALADGTINVGDLAASLLFWGDKVRTRWAFEYYAAGAAAPPGDATPEPTSSDAPPL